MTDTAIRRVRFTALLTAAALVSGCNPGSSIGNAVDAAVTAISGSTSATSQSSASVNAGPDVSVTLPDTRVQLVGSATRGTMKWSQINGPSTVAFQNDASLVTNIAADVPGIYKLRLSATDAQGRTLGNDTVVVTVNPNPVQIGASSTPLDHIRSFARPALRTGNTLVPLTTSSCGLSDQLRVELTQYWG